MGLIALNVLAFLVSQGGADEVLEAFALAHGKGLYPIQWVTSNFLHYGFFHLAGNMLFLWGFGLVVEGKIGPLWFVPIYFGIGIAECAIEQLLFSGPGISFGASAIVYGLMVMALLWAPRNEMTIGWWFFLRGGMFDMSILWFAMLLLFESVAFALMLGLHSSETLHLMGGVLGGIVGLVLLWTRTVDCEGWDLISVLRGTTPDPSRFVSRAGAPQFGKRKPKRRARRSRKEKDLAPKSSDVIEKPRPGHFEKLVAAGKFTAAYSELQQIRLTRPDWQPPLRMLRKLARELRRRRQFDAAFACDLEYLRGVQFADAAAVLDAAEILVVIKTRPRAALKLFEHIDVQQLSPDALKRYQKVQQAARKIIDSGVLELEENLGLDAQQNS